MSYLRKFEYKIIPEESYIIIRNCPVCGCKSAYGSSNNFRINANGNRIDVWLIYQCKKCRHTYNLTIYERVRTENFSPHHYNRFMENDRELAMKYGTDKSTFVKNKAEIDLNGIRYKIIRTETQKLVADEQIRFQTGDLIEIENPCGIKVRTDKIVAEILHIARNKEKHLEKTGKIVILKNHLEQNIDILLRGEIYNE